MSEKDKFMLELAAQLLQARYTILATAEQRVTTFSTKAAVFDFEEMLEMIRERFDSWLTEK